jgi:hypothetical protein
VPHANVAPFYCSQESIPVLSLVEATDPDPDPFIFLFGARLADRLLEIVAIFDLYHLLE